MTGPRRKDKETRRGGPQGGAGDGANADALAFGHWLFAQTCDFVTAATKRESIPPVSRPEVAFAGRSNVGKSSLINALTGRKTLARTSRTPGRTRQINFFALGQGLMLTDLPGYGFARAPKTEIAAWTALVEAYLRERANLRRLCLLIDARLGLKDSDRDLMARLDTDAVGYQVILTKADKVPAAALETRLAALAGELAGHPAAHPEICVTSARTGRGIADLRATLAALTTDPRGDAGAGRG